jgi:hypothetical protein
MNNKKNIIVDLNFLSLKISFIYFPPPKVDDLLAYLSFPFAKRELQGIPHI